MERCFYVASVFPVLKPKKQSQEEHSHPSGYYAGQDWEDYSAKNGLSRERQGIFSYVLLPEQT